VPALQRLKQCHDRRIELDTHIKRLDNQITDDSRRFQSCMYQLLNALARVSTISGNTGNLLEFEMPSGNTGNLLEFSCFPWKFIYNRLMIDN